MKVSISASDYVTGEMDLIIREGMTSLEWAKIILKAVESLPPDLSALHGMKPISDIVRGLLIESDRPVCGSQAPQREGDFRLLSTAEVFMEVAAWGDDFSAGGTDEERYRAAPRVDAHSNVLASLRRTYVLLSAKKRQVCVFETTWIPWVKSGRRGVSISFWYELKQDDPKLDWKNLNGLTDLFDSHPSDDPEEELPRQILRRLYLAMRETADISRQKYEALFEIQNTLGGFLLRLNDPIV